MVNRQNLSGHTITGIHDEVYKYCNLSQCTFVDCSGLTFTRCNLFWVTDLPVDSTIEDSPYLAGPMPEPETVEVHITCEDGTVITESIPVT